jgi:hypothetical protein
MENMENSSNETLYTESISSETMSLNPSKEKYTLCCCISDKWCFEHSGIAGFKQYDEHKNNCCTCLDCCTWCLEFKFKKPMNCIKDTNCYICCFTIYFT